MLKLTEEVGEVAADIYRENHWTALDEIGDCLIVLTVLAYYLDAEIETIFRDAADRFCAREFDESFEQRKRKQIDALKAWDAQRKVDG